MGVISSKVIEAKKRSSIPNCSSGPMSRAKEDRRILVEEIDRLMEGLLDKNENIDRLEAKVEQLQVVVEKLQGNHDHPENCCERCGGRNVVWYADNDLWDEVIARNPTCIDGVLCPICFIEVAEEQGCQPTSWRLSADILDQQPVTADGVSAYDGMPLYRENLDDDICRCHVKTEAYWVTNDGRHIVGDIGDFYSTQKAARKAREDQNDTTNK